MTKERKYSRLYDEDPADSDEDPTPRPPELDALLDAIAGRPVAADPAPKIQTLAELLGDEPSEPNPPTPDWLEKKIESTRIEHARQRETDEAKATIGPCNFCGFLTFKGIGGICSACGNPADEQISDDDDTEESEIEQ